MPFASHPSFNEPNDTDLLWRYMDLPKFASLITSNKLWFSNAEILALEDPQEAALPPAHFAHRDWHSIKDVPADIIDRLKIKAFDQGKTFEEILSAEKYLREHRIISAYLFRRGFFVSCWHLSSYESAAMWKIYGSPGPGIAIATTFSKLKAAIETEIKTIYIGRVEYYDPSIYYIGEENALNAIVTKRNSFRYENEVRLVYWNGSGVDISNSLYVHTESKHIIEAYEKDKYELGVNVSCNLQDLVQDVWISPTSPEWYSKTVSSLCDLVGLSHNIRRSNLLNPPLR